MMPCGFTTAYEGLAVLVFPGIMYVSRGGGLYSGNLGFGEKSKRKKKIFLLLLFRRFTARGRSCPEGVAADLVEIL